MKIRANGEIHWEKKYGGTGWEAVRSLRQTIDGGYIFCGGSSSPPSGNKESPHFGAEDTWVVKVNAEGTSYYRLRGAGSATDVLSFGTLLSWPASINHVLEYSANSGSEWTAFAGEEGTIGETRYAIVPERMKDHYFRTRRAM